MIIHKCIVHVLDKNNDFPILNDFEGKINAEIDNFFQKNINRVLKDDDLRKASFNNYNDNVIKNCCEAIIYNEDTFIENSKEIASYLFEIIKINEEMESCDLAICIYSHKEEKNIAIIKLDYKKLYTHSIEFIDEKFNIQMVSNQIAIQETSRQKQCAVIGPSGINDEFHLFVLDKESEKNEEETKFLSEFLNVEKVSDDIHKTKVFKKETEKWINSSLNLDVKKAEEVRSMLHFNLKDKNEINPEKFMNTVLVDEELKESFKEKMINSGIENSFEIDKKWINKTLKKRSIKTDNGFEIKSDSFNFEDPMKYSIRKNDNGTFDIVIKNISYLE